MIRINALVTAKSFSRRISNKNFTEVLGKPLYKWTTEFLEQYGFIFNRIYFSSDKPILFEFNQSKIISIERPVSLCVDSASHIEVVKHAMAEMDNVPDFIMLFQPTNPFRSITDIAHAINLARRIKDIGMITSYYFDYNLKSSYIKHANIREEEVRIKSGNFYLYNTIALHNNNLKPILSFAIPKVRGYNINVPEDIPIIEALGRFNEI
jgi:CMP-N-acetylneuraminic acid synthetase